MALSGKYKIQNPKKYIGNADMIFFRSSWELRVFRRFDNDPNILRWNSEEVIIPYFFPVDNKWHRYYVDLYCELKQKDGSVHQYIIEIKPHKYLSPPEFKGTTKNKRPSKSFLRECFEYKKNQAKWEAAREFAKKQNLEFLILTEKNAGF